MYDSYEQWFSNDRITGYSDTLNAASAIASSTSCTNHAHKCSIIIIIITTTIIITRATALRPEHIAKQILATSVRPHHVDITHANSCYFGVTEIPR